MTKLTRPLLAISLSVASAVLLSACAIPVQEIPTDPAPRTFETIIPTDSSFTSPEDGPEDIVIEEIPEEELEVDVVEEPQEIDLSVGGAEVPVFGDPVGGF